MFLRLVVMCGFNSFLDLLAAHIWLMFFLDALATRGWIWSDSFDGLVDLLGSLVFFVAMWEARPHV